MNLKSLHTLEFPKITERLSQLAGSPSGKALCRALLPSSDLAQIRAWQTETSLALSLIYQKGSLSFSGVTDIRGSLKRLEIGGVLSQAELLAISRLLEVCGRAKSFSRGEIREEGPNCLDVLFDALQPLSPLANEIRRCILSEEEISDDASPTLRGIRRSLGQMNDKIHAALNSMVNGPSRTYLQDAVVTMRNGRYCLPVKAEHRGQVQGMIHDQSSTGSTLFVEPLAVLKLNNELRELELREEKEIEVILANLSARAAEETDALLTDFTVLTQLDFIFARANLSKSYKGSEPIFGEDGVIQIKKGRHPLLDPKKVVPIDVRLGEDFDLLVVTGPNTGGKTVSLKTVGLFTLMGQAGLHIPAFDQSRLAVFSDVYADIGDEQSIEQSLSTFSSHMTNIVSILKEADARSLVLFDELGAGTDPTEGAALAISILSYLHRLGARAMATTHYSELKVYALSTPRVENACMEFDVETLAPTYRLLVGIPGKSNAFAISAKLGLPDDIIADARAQISKQDADFEELLGDLETRRVAMEREREEIEKNRREAAQLKDRLSQKQENLNASRDRILQEAREQAQAILREAKDYADTTIKNFQKYGKEGMTAREMEEERARLRKKMDAMDASAVAKKKPDESKKLQAKDLHIGDSVRVASLNLKGTVSTLPDAKGNLYVQMGILRSQVNLSDLERVADADDFSGKKQKNSSGSGGFLSKSATISHEINLIGKTTDEALRELDKYLDDAYLSHVPSVRVVHGKGTGALRKAVHNYLRKQKHVDSYRLGEFGEGDSGVTIVTFK